MRNQILFLAPITAYSPKNTIFVKFGKKISCIVKNYIRFNIYFFKVQRYIFFKYSKITFFHYFLFCFMNREEMSGIMDQFKQIEKMDGSWLTNQTSYLVIF